MELVPVKVESIVSSDRKYSYRRAEKVIESFIRSNESAVELVYRRDEYANPSSVYGTYYRAAKRLKVGCYVVLRDKKVYIVRK